MLSLFLLLLLPPLFLVVMLSMFLLTLVVLLLSMLLLLRFSQSMYQLMQIKMLRSSWGELGIAFERSDWLRQDRLILCISASPE